MQEAVRRTRSGHWGKLLRLLWRNHPWLTLGTALAAITGGLASVAAIDIISSAVDQPTERMAMLLPFIALNVAAVALKGGSSALAAYASMRVMSSVRIRLCRKILRTPLEEVDARGAANILTLLTNDVPTLSRTLFLLPSIAAAAAIFVFGVAYVAYLSWMAFAMTVAVLAIAVVAYFSMLNRAMSFSRSTRNEIDTFNEHTHGLLFGIKELQLNSQRRSWFEREGIETASRQIARYGFIEQLFFAAGSNVATLTHALLLGILIFGVPSLQWLDAATLTACVLVVLYIMGPMGIVIGAVPQLGQATVACERIAGFGFSFDVHAPDAPDQTSSPDADGSLRNWQAIELHGIKARYHSEETATHFELGPIDLRLHPGELVFIIGGNGSGKSTLAKILTGLYTPTAGRVLLDGQAVDERRREAYRSLFSTVFTDFHLFDRVVGASSAPADQAQEYLTMLGVANKVRIEDGAYSTTKALSSGQRKRLALVSAYLEDRMIYVLDEWAADQDPSFKSLFYRVLLPDLRRRGKCVIIITHDDQYFEVADRIIKMSDGRIVSDLRTGGNAGDIERIKAENHEHECIG